MKHILLIFGCVLALSGAALAEPPPPVPPAPPPPPPMAVPVVWTKTAPPAPLPMEVVRRSRPNLGVDGVAPVGRGRELAILLALGAIFSVGLFTFWRARPEE